MNENDFSRQKASDGDVVKVRMLWMLWLLALAQWFLELQPEEKTLTKRRTPRNGSVYLSNRMRQKGLVRQKDGYFEQESITLFEIASRGERNPAF